MSNSTQNIKEWAGDPMHPRDSTQNCNCIESGYAQTTNHCPVHKNCKKDWTKEVEYQIFKAFMLKVGGTKDYKKYSRRIIRLVKKELADARREVITGETSDGYHTFNELYEFRKLFNALLFNEWAKQGLYDVHKSTRHFDGEECFGGGWFIVMAETPKGQISNHYEMKDWDLFKIPTKDKANKWDGHTAQDVLKTLSVLATLKEEKI